VSGSALVASHLLNVRPRPYSDPAASVVEERPSLREHEVGNWPVGDVRRCARCGRLREL